MALTATTDRQFNETLEQWILTEKEILVLFRYPYAAGSKEFEFFSSFQSLSEKLRRLSPRTSVIAFKHKQLPLRGTVDDAFIQACLNNAPFIAEFLVADMAPQQSGKYSYFRHSAGETLEELKDSLDGFRERTVAVGNYPDWIEDNENVISGYVPDPDGWVNSVAY